MPDMEKVTYGLRCLCYGDTECKECPYAKDGSGWYGCRSNCAEDALALLKEQETEISRISNEYLDLAKKASKQPQIVRCKDCKWWDKKGESPYGYCHACKHGYSSPNWEIGIYRTYKGDWFCADGERGDTE